MALRYEWGFDTHHLADGFKLNVDDGTDSGAIAFTDASHCHTSLSTLTDPPISGGFSDLAGALEADIQAVLTTNAGSVSVSFSGTQYTLTFGVNTTLDFRTATLGDGGGVNLARWLGFTASHPDGSGSGYECSLTGATSYTSDVRPYGLILPAIQGRSKMRPLYEQPELTQAASSDDGTFYFVSRDGAAKMAEWTQAFEDPGNLPSDGTSNGMPVFKSEETAEIPWSYERAFEHARMGGSTPFLVVDGSDSIVYQLEAGGTAMSPERAASEDIDLWNVRFRCVRLGSL